MTLVVTIAALLSLGNVGLGTWSWGNKLLYDYKSEEDNPAILGAFKAARDKGVVLFDTGDSYGTGKLQGNAERLLALAFEKEQMDFALFPKQKPIYLAKIAPYPWILTPAQYLRNIASSRDRLQVSSSGANFIPSLHWSPATYNPLQVRPLYSALAEAYLSGLAPSGVAVSNLGATELLRASDFFQKRGVPLVANQVQCSLVSDLDADVLPALAVGRDIGAATIGYSALGLGVLWKDRTRRGGLRSLAFDRIMEDPKAMDEMGGRTGITRQQVALSWVESKGCRVQGSIES